MLCLLIDAFALQQCRVIFAMILFFMLHAATLLMPAAFDTTPRRHTAVTHEPSYVTTYMSATPYFFDYFSPSYIMLPRHAHTAAAFAATCYMTYAAAAMIRCRHVTLFRHYFHADATLLPCLRYCCYGYAMRLRCRFDADATSPLFDAAMPCRRF